MDSFLSRIDPPKPPRQITGPTVPPPDAYTKKALEDEIQELANFASGGRNNQLNISALKLASLPLDRDDLRDKLIDACHTNGLIQDDGIVSVEKTIDSAFRKADSQPPRTVPERAPRLSIVGGGNGAPRANDTAGMGHSAEVGEAPGLTRPSELKSRLLSPSDLKDLPEPVPLIDGVLDRGTTGLLFGKYGSCKSFISLDWALSVASGHGWQGRKVQRAKVLYVVAEGVAGFSGRLDAWQVGWRTSVADEQIAFLPVPVNLMTRDVDRLAVEIQGGGYEFIILDTIARCTVGADENSARDVGVVVDSMTRLMDATPNHQGMVLGVHHAGKSGTLRGSSAYEAGVDTVYSVERDGDILLKCTKRKDGPDDYRHRLRLAPIDGTDSCIVETVTRDSDGDDAAAVVTLKRIMTEMFADTGVSNTDLRTVCEEQGLSPSVLYRARADLVRSGWLVNSGTGQRQHWKVAKRSQDQQEWI